MSSTKPLFPGKKQHVKELFGFGRISFPNSAPKHHQAAWAGSQPAQLLRNATTHGVPRRLPLLTPSPLPRAAFQLEEAKHPTFPAHQ